MPVRRPQPDSPPAVAHRLREEALRQRSQRQANPRRLGLRLSGEGGTRSRPLNAIGTSIAEASAAAPAGQALRGDSDPRWSLAVRVAADMEGAILSPEKRDRLVRLGKTMGLTPFDANLVIAIVQDQARRGVLADYCPQAAAAQLAMVPAPRRAIDRGWHQVAATAGALMALQAGLLWWLLW